jgi:hypothetical protein
MEPSTRAEVHTKSQSHALSASTLALFPGHRFKSAVRSHSPSLEDRITAGEIPLFFEHILRHRPILHPGAIDQWGYYYAFAERPGIHVREFVSEDFNTHGYWRFKDDYNLQVGNGSGGDLPNRLCGHPARRSGYAKSQRPARAHVATLRAGFVRSYRLLEIAVDTSCRIRYSYGRPRILLEFRCDERADTFRHTSRPYWRSSRNSTPVGRMVAAIHASSYGSREC